MRSRFLRNRRGPLENQVQTDRPVGHAIFVRSDERGCRDELPALGAGAVDPGVKAAHHSSFFIAEDDHSIEVLPLHDRSHALFSLAHGSAETASRQALARWSASQAAAVSRAEELNLSSLWLNQRGR